MNIRLFATLLLGLAIGVGVMTYQVVDLVYLKHIIGAFLGFMLYFIVDIYRAGISDISHFDWCLWWKKNNLPVIIALITVISGLIIGWEQGIMTFEKAIGLAFAPPSILKNFLTGQKKIQDANNSYTEEKP